MKYQAKPEKGLPVAFKEGRYEVIELLGAGSQKRVYRARDRALDRDVAVAIIEKREKNASWISRFEREARATGRVGTHRNIVTIYDTWADGDRSSIVMELLPGGDLAAMLRGADDGRLDWQRATHIAEEICRALEHAHSLRVIHRDVKPENIWFAADGTAKLGDFGLALVGDLSRLSAEGTFVGTVAYLPPEQAVGQPCVTQSDIYSLGAVLYEMVTGRPPFVGEDAASVVSQQVSVSPLAPSVFNREVPRVLDELILELLAKRPEQRPDSAATVAGRLASIRATAIAGVARAQPQRHEDPLAPAGFVGRRKELARLCSAFDKALSRQTALRVLVGEAGIGKSRTAAELASYAGLRGAGVFYGRCYEGRGAPAYWPWVQLLRSYAQASDRQALMSQLGSRAAVIGQVVPTILEGLPALAPPPNVDPDQARFRFFDSVAEFIQRATAEQPLLLVIEDIQWADVPSLLLLEFLAHELRTERLLIAVTCRTTDIERAEPTAETLAKVSRESIYDRVVLQGMSENDVRELLISLGGRDVSPAFVRDIHRQTEGNPFFIEEMLRHLLDEGFIRREVGGWVGTRPLASVGVPEEVRSVIARRLSRLSEPCRQVLTIGSVIGREFSLRAAAEASGRPHAEVLELIEQAVGASVLSKPHDRRGDQYTFSHALIRECLYEELSPLQRARLHRQAGEGLERLYGSNSDPHVTELARHFCEAMRDGNAAKAIDYSTRAAARANRLLAYEEATRHYERALEALSLETPRNDEKEARILLALGDTLWSAGETNTARDTFLRAAALARRLADPQLLAAAALGAGGRYPGLQIGILDERLVDLLEEALAALEGTTAPPVPEIMARLAEALSFAPVFERRQSLARTAIETARRHGDPFELAKVLQHAHLPLWAPENVEERLDMSSEMLALAQRTGSIGVNLAARGWRAVHLLEIGDIDEFRHEVEDFSRVAGELHQPVYQYVAHLRKTMYVLLEARFAEAEELASRTIALGERAQIETAAQAFGAQIYQIRMAQGRLAELEPAVRGLVEQFPIVPGWRIALALTYTQMGRRAGARRELDGLLNKGLDDIPRDLNFYCGLSLLANVAAYLEDVSCAKLLYDLLLPHAHRLVMASGTATLGSTSLFLGVLANTLERWNDAEKHFQDALGMNTRIGAPLWIAHTAVEYAEMLLARDGSGDRAKAAEMLALSRPIAANLDLQSLMDRIAANAARLRPATGVEGTEQ
jgi:eukaryotic-like serine/threonine-protein kinase